MFYPIYKAVKELYKEEKTSKKKGANPRFFVLFVGYWLLYVVQTG